MKGQLEKDFQYQSFSLIPFSEEGKKIFLMKFWNKIYVGIKPDYL